MEYFTVEISVVNGTTIQAIFKRADEKAAVSAFHSFMASCLANNACTQALCMVINSTGAILKKDVYIQPTGEN